MVSATITFCFSSPHPSFNTYHSRSDSRPTYSLILHVTCTLFWSFYPLSSTSVTSINSSEWWMVDDSKFFFWHKTHVLTKVRSCRFRSERGVHTSRSNQVYLQFANIWLRAAFELDWLNTCILFYTDVFAKQETRKTANTHTQTHVYHYWF